ncbi:MAG TPA: NAD(+) synthase [Thermomicrobiales bacterium]|jgi:NAD+ synthase|nr:NAD(+) synthase [Thermomicrobiales bacterium]
MSDTPPTDFASLADEIAGWLRFQMDQVGATRLVLGLSGGIDSAVVCALCTMAAGPSRVIPAIMPIHSRPEDVRDAELVASAFEVVPRVIDLVPAHDALVAAMPGDDAAGLEDANVDPARQASRHQLALANVKPRLRMTTLYFLANRYNGLVVGTGNKTELAIGYFTKYGDGGVDVLPLGDLDKTAVRGLARALGVPEPVISKAPSAGLWEGQTDEAEIGVTYDVLDRALALFAGAETREPLDSGTFDRISALVTASEHKRRPIPVFRRDTVDVVSRQ